MDYRRIFKDGIHLLAGKIGTILIGLVNLMLLARILTTEEMGKYSLFLMVVNLALIVGLNWSDASIVRHGREEYIKKQKINRSFWARIYLFAPIILLFSVILLLFHEHITNYIGIEPSLILFVIALFVLTGILNFISYIYQSTDAMKQAAYISLTQKLLLLISLGLVMLNVFKTNLTTILLLINASFLIAILTNLFFFDFKKIQPYTFDKAYFKKIWNYSWPQLLGFPGLYIINYVDFYVIKKYMTLHDVGIYSMAYNGFMNIGLIIMVFYTLIFPLIVEYKTKHQHHLIKDYLKNTPLYIGIWTALTLIGLLFSKIIITTIFSAKYVYSVPAFNILLIAGIFYFAAICLLPVINAFDLIIYLQFFNLVRAGVNIVADFLLVPKIGIIGAAYGTLLSYGIGLALSVLLISYKWKSITGGQHA